MRIGIDGHRLFRRRKHGMEIVTIELIKNLQILDTENQYYIFVEPDQDKDCIKETENFKIVNIKVGSFPIWEQFALPFYASKYHCDLLHCTSNTAPMFLKIPLVVTIHDMIYLEKSYFKIIDNQGTSYQRFGNMYRRFIVPRIAKSAQKIITVSDFEKHQINDYFHFSPSINKVISIYNGVNEHFRKINDLDALRSIKEKYNLPDEFILFLGNTDPKKNTTNVIKAYFEFLKSNPGNIKLVIIDYQVEQLKKQLNEIGNQELAENIHLTGYVINADLPAIYSMSKMFLYPSLRESFGIPLLEAMHCETPVITSNTSAMPEVAGDASLLINPFEPNEISKAMKLLNSNQELRNDLKIKGLAQSSKFSWRTMAENVLQTYYDVLKQNNQFQIG